MLSHHTCESAVAIEGTETATNDGTAAAAASSPQLATAIESPFASETSQEAPPKPKRGRPKGSSKKSKAPGGSEAEPAKAKDPAAAASKTSKPKRRNRRKNTETDATVEPGVAVNQEAAEEAAGGNDYAEADSAADAAARLEMARKASTGDGSRLERPPVADFGDTGLSSVQAGTHPQADPQADPRQADSRQDAVEAAPVQHGARVFNPVSTATKPPHRLSKVTGRTAPKFTPSTSVCTTLD